MISEQWFSILNTYQYLIIAFSGGLDSTVLLHLLSQNQALSSKIKAIHVHHGLHKDASLWAAHCLSFCEAYRIPCRVKNIVINPQSNIEEKARIARYDVLQREINMYSCLLTAHHQEDQAETVLLNLMRGAGINGLCAMPESKPFGESYLYRPLLKVSRDELADYAQKHALNWLEDPANQDRNFSRNFVRHEVLPLLKKRWPASKMLFRTSQLAQEAQHNLDDLAKIDYPDIQQKKLQRKGFIEQTICLSPLLALSESRVKNVIRFWLKQFNVRPLSSIIWHRLYKELIHARKDSNPAIPWDGYIFRRYQHKLYLTELNVQYPKGKIWDNFPNALFIPDFGMLYAQQFEEKLKIDPHQCIEIRFRQGGEKFYWHGKHQSLKKLMQNWQIPPWKRALIPLLYLDNELTCVIGYACR